MTQENEPISAFRAMATVWVRPRETMRGLMAIEPGWVPKGIVVVYGSLRALDRGAGRNVGDLLSPTMIAVIVVFAGLVSIPLWYLYAFIVRHTARLLRGNGESGSIRLALAYGPMPAVAGGFLTLVPVAIWGAEYFKKDGDLPVWSLWVVVPLFAVQMGLAMWAMITMSKCVGEACGFSAWRGWFSMVIPFVAFLLVVIGVVVAILALR